MKKFSLLMILLFSINSFSQDKMDFKRRTSYADDFAISLMKTYKKDSPAQTYALLKFKALDYDGKTVIKLTETQKEKLQKIFESQYSTFKDAFEKYKNGKSVQSKIDLIKILLKNEDDFRALLTDKQAIYYKSYDPEAKFISNLEFTYYFMTEQHYNGYKKELL